MRIFLAIDIGVEAKREIEKFLNFLKKKHWPVNWEEPEKLHQTLVFLGEVEENKIKLVKEVCRQAKENIKPFNLSFKGVGCFPNYDYPRVIWLGLKGDLQKLALLQKQLFSFLAKKGFNLERRPFSPHITLGRIKSCRLKQRREIGRQLKSLRVGKFISLISVDKLFIYESKLSSQGSVYKKIAVFSLS